MFNWFSKKKADSSLAPAQSRRHPMLDLALEDLAPKEDDVILDLGLTDFESARSLLPKLPRGRFLGVSSSSSQLVNAEREFAEAARAFRADFKEGGGARIPFGDGYATALLCLDQSHTWINLEKSFDEINRVLAPGARFVIVWSQPLDADTQSNRRIIDPDHMKRLLHAAGFHQPRFRERLDEQWRYYQFLVSKP